MKKEKNNYIGYYIVSRVLKFVGHLYFSEKVIGKENISKSGGCILAGNHVSDFDAYLLYAGTKRPIHILGKSELFKGLFGWFFKMMKVIPVDRTKKNPEAKEKVIDLLNNGKVVAIFPEGTYHKENLLLPFKPGVISFAEKTGVPIIPFAIKGNFKFKSHPIIEFGKPIYINEVKEKDKVKYLENVIKDMLINIKKSN